MPRPASPVAADLARAAARLDRWRRARTGRRVPPDLWRLARGLACRHGVSAASRALRLDYYALKRRVEAPAARRRSRRPAFVEIAPALAPTPVVVEIEDGRGARMRIELRGADAARVADLVRALLAR